MTPKTKPGPHVEVISTGPPDRTIREILRDPPRLELISPASSCRVITVPVPVTLHIDDNGRVDRIDLPSYKDAQIAFNAYRGQATDPRWPCRDHEIEQSILAGRLTTAEASTYCARVGITLNDIKRDHFHE